QFPMAGFGLSYSAIDDIKPYPQLILSKEIIRGEYLDKSLLGVGPSASIIRTDVFNKVKGFSGKLYIGDNELWYKLAQEHSMVKLAPALNWYRVHENQQTNFESKIYNSRLVRFNLSVDFLKMNRKFFSAEE